jgi:hypothetical protein
MINKTLNENATLYTVVHPLDDLPEKKRNVDELGPMPRTPGVRFTLIALRAYLIVMGVLVAYLAMAHAGH